MATIQHKDLTGADLHPPGAHTHGTDDITGLIQGVSNEVPSGLINGINVTFTTASSFAPTTTKVYLNGLRQMLTDDYIETSDTIITFVTPPEAGDKIVMDYDR